MVDSRIPMKNVTDYLKIVQDNYTDLIILGDNYYPQNSIKVTDPITGAQIKKKEFNQTEFNAGFDMVESIGIPNKYLIMGNHDLEDTLLDNCIGLELQKAKSDKFNIKFPYGKHQVSVDSSNYKYIFIDTNLYNLIDKINTCFDIVEKKNVTQLLYEQNRFIIEELNDPTIKKFLIFGHEPLITLKSKILVEQEIRKDNSILNENLLKILFDSGKEIIYICADVHMYQNGIIKNSEGKTIQQIVCGTGGADKDYYCLSSKYHKLGTVDIYDFELVNFIDGYGYVEIVLTSEGINHQYIKIHKNLSVDRYSKKYYINYN
jgi:hypothetical protein